MQPFISRLRSTLVIALLGGLAVGCQDASSPVAPATARPEVSAATASSGGASLAWQATARGVLLAHAADVIVSNRPSPNAQIRILAYLGLAQYTALVSAEEHRADGARPSAQAAIAGASAAVLSYFFPVDADALEAQVRAQAAALPPGDAQTRFALGEVIGRNVAARLIERASTDRFSAPFTGTIPVGPQYWRSSNVPPTPPLLPLLGKMRPFFLLTGDQFRPPPPPEFGSADYLAALAEVRHFSDTRTAEQLAIAKYWAPPSLGSLWDDTLALMVVKYHFNETQAAHAFALTFMAGIDALIACHDAKYTYWFVRPSQADPGIVLAVPLPNHPSYPSNHACVDGALDTVLSHLFPAEADRLHALSEQGAISRLYGGLHYRFDATAGLAVGHAVGELALASDVGWHRQFALR